MYYSIYNCVQDCENENACSENFVMFCCRQFYCIRIELHCKHMSIEFLTTQTDQSKRDILIDYVLILFFRLRCYSASFPLIIFLSFSSLFFEEVKAAPFFSFSTVSFATSRASFQIYFLRSVIFSRQRSVE